MAAAAHVLTMRLSLVPSTAPAPSLPRWVNQSGSVLAGTVCSYSTGGSAAHRGVRCTVVALAAAAKATACRSAKRKLRTVKLGKVSLERLVPEQIARPPYLGPGSPRTPKDGMPQHEFMWDPDNLHRIEVKRPESIAAMRESCALARETLEFAGRLVVPGVTTDAIDAAVHDFIISRGAYPSPLGYMGFPKAICTSVNDVIAHGIPDDRPLEDGDIVNVDVTVYLNGHHGDTSSMFFAGRPKKSTAALCDATQRAMNAGIEVCGPGVDFREIGRRIAVVTDEADCHCSSLLSGHGIGTYFHGAPEVIPGINNVDQGVMMPGMTFTIEPSLVENNDATSRMLADGWALQTQTGALTAQFEHTVLITEEGHEVLTGPSVDYRGILREKLRLAEKAPGAPAKTPQRSGGGSSSSARSGRRPASFG